MGTVLFIIVLIASWIVVRIGAVAFQLTGLEWSLAKSARTARSSTKRLPSPS